MSDYSSDEIPPVVIDNGSRIYKAGFAGDKTARDWRPAIIGRPTNGSHNHHVKDCYIGHDAQTHRDMLSISYPIQRGVVTNWEDMEKLWSYSMYNELKCEPGENAVLITEAPLNPKANREQMAQVMFETFNVPGLHVAIGAALSLYSNGRVSSLAVDCGDGVTHTVPVFEGHSIPKAIHRIDVAGTDVTRYLQKLINDRGYSFVTTTDFEIVREIKEKLCFVDQKCRYETNPVFARYSSATETSYELPDGQNIIIGDERHRSTEILFNPSLARINSLPGIHTITYNSIMDCDTDIRKLMFLNTFLVGGTTMLPGLDNRLSYELSALAPPSCRVRVQAPPERCKSVWLGGSVLGSLPSFDEMLISKQDYEDVGPSIAHRCF